MAVNRRPEPVAVVGIGCRLPGGADSPANLWQLLLDRFDAIGEVPPSRFDLDALYDPRPATPGRVMSRFGGFLSEVDELDADFFRLSPREADRLDPQQRLLLETTWEAMEDAGLTATAVSGSSTGVFIGMWINELEAQLFSDLDAIDFHMTTGTGRYAASGRLSYFLDLLGPSITIDTACSSSLVAVHLACQSLGAGDCDLAFAGGANVILDPTITIAYSQSKMMAPDGHCKFGDASADGYVRSDGAAVIALKRLSDAHAAGDRIHAVIRGSAVTNDGHSSGYLATPGRAGQEHMLRQAYANAGVDPATVQYIEAHGTGTAAGDPVELGAIGAVTSVGRPPGRPCLVGSVKTNCGHTEGAAGVAGLIKVALALEHGEVPPSLHLNEPNPNIPWDELQLAVCAERHRFDTSNGPPLAGVSSFGIAGTNAHVVLEAPPAANRAPEVADVSGPHLLVISARSTAALRSLAAGYAGLLGSDRVLTAQVCAAAATRRTHLEHRLAVVGSDSDLVEALTAFADGDEHPALRTAIVDGAVPRVVFVFPGQGSQWVGMARELLADDPVFRRAFERCDAAILAETGWSPVEVLADDRDDRLEEIDVIQPLLFAIQVSLAARLRAWGLEPVAVVGHSMGEAAAAHVAGALTLNDAVSVICTRSRLLHRISGEGAMAVVDLPAAEAQAAIAGREHELSIAANNSPRSTVLAGDPGALDAVLAELTAGDVFCRLVKVDVASHSPQVEPLLEELADALVDLTPAAASIAFHSTVDAAVVDGELLDAGYWVRNLRQPVRFAEAVDRLASSGPTVFVELGPHPVLLPAIEQASGQAELRTIATMRRGEPQLVAVLQALADAHLAGAALDWSAIVGDATAHADLPLYPWQRQRYWYNAPRRRTGGRSGHLMLGDAVRPASEPGTVHWQTTLDAHELAFLSGHVVGGEALMPAAGFIEIVGAAAREAFGPTAPLGLDIVDLEITEALPLDTDRERQLQVTLHSSGTHGGRVHVYSGDAAGPGGGATVWRLHATATVVTSGEAPASGDLTAARSRCPTHRDAAAHQATMRARALDYDGVFRTVREAWLGDREIVGRLAPVDGPIDPVPTRIGLVDGYLQLAVALVEKAAGETFYPVSVDRISSRELPVDGSETWAGVSLLETHHDSVRADIEVFDAAEALVGVMSGVELRRAGGGSRRLDDLFHGIAWQAAERSSPVEVGPRRWLVYADGPFGDSLVEMLRAAGDACTVVAPGTAFRRVDDHRLEVDPVSAADHQAALAAATSQSPDPWAGVVYAWAAEIGPDAIADAARLGCEAVVALVQGWAALYDAGDPVEEPRLWLATRGAQHVGSDDEVEPAPTQAVVWGIGRVLAAERPTCKLTLVDVERGSEGVAQLVDELHAGSDERQVGLRDVARLVPRLLRLSVDPLPAPSRRQTDEYRLAVAEPGVLESVRPTSVPRRAPGADEVEVRIAAAALNFLDVLKAMGVCPGFAPSPDVALGAEAAGVVTAIGPAVEGVSVGDEVVVVTPSYDRVGLLARYATVPAAFVAPRPSHLTLEESCAVPVGYLTAYYGLVELGRLHAGDRVLIHAATGGVGLAAIELCRNVGAEIYATAGTPAKRERLKAMGIDHVYDSRTLDFARAVLDDTDGRGVDIVLNSLVGAAIPAGLSTLAPRGRFIEIGKRDVYADTRLGMAALKHNIAVHVVDLAGLTEDDPDYVAELFRRVVTMVANRQLAALPVAAAPISDVADSFRTMAQAGHVGKLVIALPDVGVAADVGIVQPDATYLITGGLGALGLATAHRLVVAGARHVALLGRSAPVDTAAEAIASMRAVGVAVEVVTADVTDLDGLTAAVEHMRETLPPIRGVIHAAGALADATVERMDPDQLHAALDPKLAGGWNVHRATLDDPLDFFVTFASVAAVLGLPGQANYAAGNAYLDALAHARRHAGLPAQSIDWGPWSEIGLAAAEQGRGGRLDELGLGGLATEEALDALELLLGSDITQPVAMRFDARRWVEATIASNLLDELADAAPLEFPTGGSLLERMLEVPAGAPRRTALEAVVRAELAHVLRVAADRIDRSRPLEELGLDSLMALELRNRLEAQTEVKLSATLAFNYPTVGALAEHVAERMALALDRVDDGPDDLAGPPGGTVEEPSSDLAAGMVSDEDVESLLADELDEVQRLLESDTRWP